MAKTFFFYDLETSGLDPRYSRIMQFAGQRTDLELNPIGEPYNFSVKLNDDTLPSPDALMVTGISPQQTLDDGYTEAEAVKIILNEIFTDDTIAVGFNNIRFDDEFIRHLLWRNFYDPYEWSWRDGRSRWDLLDVVRMTRALRPEGIEWPVDAEGKATNRLELISAVNGLVHTKAHDALSDVEALIDVTRLIKSKQPQLYEYLLKLRDKNEVKKLVSLDNKQPFVYVSGRYDAEFQKATVAFPLTSGPNGSVIVYDLRYDPEVFLSMSAKEIAAKIYAPWDERKAEGFVKLPVKQLHLNKAPAVAPLGVLESGDGWKKIGMSEDIIKKHLNKLMSVPAFAENVRSVFENKKEYPKADDPEAQLYDGFLPDIDRMRCELVRNANASELADLHPVFTDERLDDLLLHYKARNFPSSLAEDEVVKWEKWRAARIIAQLPSFMESLKRLDKEITDDGKRFVLEELQLYLESVMPVED